MSDFDTPPPTPNPFDQESEEDMEDDVEVIVSDDDLQLYEDEDDGAGLDEQFSALDEAVSRGMRQLEDEMDMESTSTHCETLDKPNIVFNKHKDSVFVCDIEKESGDLVVTGGQDDVAYVWKLTTGDICLVCDGHKDSVTHALFSNDSKYLATADMSGNIIVWSASSLTKVMNVQVEDILWMKWHIKANVLFTGVVDGLVYFWEIPSQKCKVISATGEGTGDAVIMPDGVRISVGYNDGTVRVINLKDLSVQYTIKTPRHDDEEDIQFPVLCMDTHPNNNLVVYGDAQKNVVLFQSQSGKVIHTFDGNQSIESVLFLKKSSSELNIIIAGNTVGQVFVWDYSKKALRHKVETECGISKIIFTDDETKILVASLHGLVFVINVLNGQNLQTFACHNDNILDICFIPMISAFVTTSDDHTARVFELKQKGKTAQ